MSGIHAYRRTTVESAPSEDVLVMLLEAAIRREDAADAAMEAEDRVRWQHELHVARAIFVELRAALDHRAAPEITVPLRNTYAWCAHHLLEAGRTGDRERLASVREVTLTLHGTWTEAIRSTRAWGA